MQPVERNILTTNLLAGSPSLYLRQHAHNPVFWYPWSKEAIERAKAEDKPIFLSIGYASCYWCHVMEREVFENPSIAAMMNSNFINIKVDREEHPDIDDLYMTARQVLRGEGGWPNNLFLTPDLKPFHAGGTYGMEESPNRPSFPRIIEWVNHVWTSQRDEALAVAEKLTGDMRRFLVHNTAQPTPALDGKSLADALFQAMRRHFDGRSGGFYQAPKFPNECYLNFLLGYAQQAGSNEAYEMVAHTLRKIAAGGVQDHVGCGFHRYAVDKEWYIPHFEKMLYTQAMLARVYTDAAERTGDAYLADIAKSILDFVGGPFTSGSGGFYTAIDAETDGVEGAYYAWSAEELKAYLSEEELLVFTQFYSIADIPQFPGHKHAEGGVIISRKPLDQAAHEQGIPYIQLAAMLGTLMNKLLEVRNKRQAPALDDKIIVGWNGLMIDAYARAGQVFNRPGYIAKAREAVDFLLEHAIDNDGNLKRIISGTTAYLEATLEDYAYLIKGILSLHRAAANDELLASAKSLVAQVEERFGGEGVGFYFVQDSEQTLFRTKSSDDSAIPGANAVMAHNYIDLHEITQQSEYRDKARALVTFFAAGNPNLNAQYATLIHAVLRLEPAYDTSAIRQRIEARIPEAVQAPITVTAALIPEEPTPGATCELGVTLAIAKGWHINANRVNNPFLIPTQLDVQGDGVEITAITYPELPANALPHYQGTVVIKAAVKLPEGPRPTLTARVRFQPCESITCHKVQDVVVEI